MHYWILFPHGYVIHQHYVTETISYQLDSIEKRVKAKLQEQQDEQLRRSQLQQMVAQQNQQVETTQSQQHVEATDSGQSAQSAQSQTGQATSAYSAENLLGELAIEIRHYMLRKLS